MNIMRRIVRNEGDPKMVKGGPRSLPPEDRLARGLGWFSIGLGLVELFAPRRITRALGMEGEENLVRAYGARELGAGVMSLSIDKGAGLWSRVVGDGLDMATLVNALGHSNRRRGAVAAAMCIVAGITVVDIVAAQRVSRLHSRKNDMPRDYSERSGFPRGVGAIHGIARKGRHDGTMPG